MKFFNKIVKKLDALDIGLTKFSVASFTLFLVAIWSGFAKWVYSINPWWFFAAAIILGARPLYRAYFKKRKK
jgi:hypothetical protein